MATMNKTTREEKRAAETAARLQARAFEYRDRFRRDRARRTYTEQAAWTAQEAGGDRSGFALYDLVRRFNDTRESLVRNVRRAQEQLAEALPRVEQGRAPFSYSNGLTGYVALDLDRDAEKLEALRGAIAMLARCTGWRVREVEADHDRAHADALEGVDVWQCGGGWGIRRLRADGTCAWFHPERVPTGMAALPDGFGPDGFEYGTEESAWQAVHVLAEGRTL